MYEATKAERKILADTYNYLPKNIDLLDAESDNVRRGIPIDIHAAMAVCDYQKILQSIRKKQKRWLPFWK